MGSADAYDRAGKACGALSLALHGALSGRAAAFGFTGTAMGAFLGQRNAQGVKQDGRPSDNYLGRLAGMVVRKL
ncbi:hypothetical protein D8I24_6630 (plasmid) [Cupriavidus necator H850]|jgi:hypothetical protein|uniref:hypothetical protein n=1 Tax=Cupriavidus necator TaxID=106590 RepID=UPI003FA4B7FC|nr:hypothetical protein D8I24_6630 [Cupriavidus necator H850]